MTDIEKLDNDIYIFYLAEVQFFLGYHPGMKKSSEKNGQIHLQAAGFIKDIRIQMLSDDNFAEVLLIYFAIFNFI